MLFTTLSALIRQSFHREIRGCGLDLPGRAREPLLAPLDAYRMVRVMRDPSRTLGEQGAVLAAVIRCYRRTPTRAWSAILLEMMSPALVESSIRFHYCPRGVTEEDVQQQVIAETLHAARFMPLPDEPRWTLRRLIEMVVDRTAITLLRAARDEEDQSLEELDEDPTSRWDADQAFLAELSAYGSIGRELALLVLAKQMRMTVREVAILMGTSSMAVKNQRRRARRRFKREIEAGQRRSHGEKEPAA